MILPLASNCAMSHHIHGTSFFTRRRAKVTNDDVIAHVSHALAATRAERTRAKLHVGQRSTVRQCDRATVRFIYTATDGL